MKRSILFAGLLATVIVAGAWMFHFQYVHLEGGGMLRENRWTGQTCSLARITNPKYQPFKFSEAYQATLKEFAGNGSILDAALTPQMRSIEAFEKQEWDKKHNPDTPETILAWTDCH